MSTSQDGGLNGSPLERRIIELLTTTNLTFKEIIIKLDGENLVASIGIIRRINRDNRYRRPRYDSKLTPAQRASLVDELRDYEGVKPNLSLLAKRYGVCHGSVWYWWDKLNRIRFCGAHLRGFYKTKRKFNRGSKQLLSALKQPLDQCNLDVCLNRANGLQSKQHNDQTNCGQKLCDGTEELENNDLKSGEFLNKNLRLVGRRQRKITSRSLTNNNLLSDSRFSLVGRVGIVAAETQQTLQSSVIELPILMFRSNDLPKPASESNFTQANQPIEASKLYQSIHQGGVNYGIVESLA